MRVAGTGAGANELVKLTGPDGDVVADVLRPHRTTLAVVRHLPIQVHLVMVDKKTAQPITVKLLA